MSIASYKRRPDYFLAEFVTRKFEPTGPRGNILLMGEDNGRNAEFLVNTFMRTWKNPSFKVYVLDDFSDKYGRQRRQAFDTITANSKDWIVHYTSADFPLLLDEEFALIIFIDFYTAPQVYSYAMKLWSTLSPGGFYYFLNYDDGTSMYLGDLNDHPREGIDRFFRDARGSASDWAMKPFPYLQKE